MFNHTIFMFIAGWALWFSIDKHPMSLGVMLPGELDSMIDNFQLAFDMMSDGFIKASYVFIWKSHFIIVSIIAGLLSTAIFQSISNILRRRRLRQVMLPVKNSDDKKVKNDTDEPL
jgi:hypothetical protein